MPQFDFVSFFVQIFWAFLFAFSFYLLIVVYFSKNLGEIFKIRNKIKNYAGVMNQKILVSDLYNQVMKHVKRR